MFFTWIQSDPRVRIVSKSWIKHVGNMGQFMTEIAIDRRIIESPWDQFNTHALLSLLFKLFREFLFDRTPFSENVYAFLTFFEYPSNQHDADSLL